MSGPKVDTAEISRQQRLALQMARDERKKRASFIITNIKEISNNFENYFQMSDIEKVKPTIDELKQKQTECINKLQHLLQKVENGNEMLKNEEIRYQCKNIVDNFNKNTSQNVAILKSINDFYVQCKEIKAKENQFDNLHKSNIILVSNDEIDKETLTIKMVDEIKSNFDVEIQEFMLSREIGAKYKDMVLILSKELNKTIQSDIFLDKKYKRMKQLFSEYQKIKSLSEREQVKMKEMYFEYTKECFDLKGQAIPFENFSSVQEISEAIENVRNIASECISKEYIKRQIDEVMAHHGYDVVRSDTLSEIVDDGQILYGLDDDTAVSVFVSDGNNVTMRVVGIGFDNEVSAVENEKLYQKQCAFCSMHPQITKELAMRGVILHAKKHMPPDRKFNKKLAVKTRNNLQHHTSHAKKELRRKELKTMQKG